MQFPFLEGEGDERKMDRKGYRGEGGHTMHMLIRFSSTT